jgi:hypothetical protein
MPFIAIKAPRFSFGAWALRREKTAPEHVQVVVLIDLAYRPCSLGGRHEEKI